MSQRIGKGSIPDLQVQEVEKVAQGIVLTDVVVKKREVLVDIPKVIVTEQVYERPVIKDVEYERPVPVDTPVARYVPVDEPTVRYVPKDLECEKPVIVEKVYEKPVIREVEYEKPVIVSKVVEVVTVEHLQNIVELAGLVESLTKTVDALKIKIASLEDVKLVEKIIHVPKIEYETVKVERIEWVPVKRQVVQ